MCPYHSQAPERRGSVTPVSAQTGAGPMTQGSSRSSPRRKPPQASKRDGSGGKPGPEWVCMSCTYKHIGPEAEFLQCRMCSSLRTLPSAVADSGAAADESPSEATPVYVASASPQQPPRQQPLPKPSLPAPAQGQSVRDIMMQQWRKAIAGETSPPTSRRPSDTHLGHEDSPTAHAQAQPMPQREVEQSSSLLAGATSPGGARAHAPTDARVPTDAVGGRGGADITAGTSGQVPKHSSPEHTTLVLPVSASPPRQQTRDEAGTVDIPKPPPRRRRSSTGINTQSPP